jgi:acyl dehydratase
MAKSSGMNRDLVGKKYEQAEPFTVTAEGARAYAEATNAGIAAYEGDDAVAPPMFGVAYGFGAMTAPLFDSDLNVDMLRLVHGEQDMRFFEPVRPGDRIAAASRILSIDEKATGEVLNLSLRCTNQDGNDVLETHAALFIKAPRKKRDRTEGQAPSDDPFDSASERFTVAQTVDDDQSVRYAAASGDRNPIHTDPEAAKMAGLPGVILHGLCTMAFVHNALVRETGGNPHAVERLAVRFSRPVLMGDVLTIAARGPATGPLHLRVTNQDGTAVLKRGLATLR